MAQDGRPVALIFRKRLLPWSETFIAAQAGTLTRYRPVFAGYAMDPAGAHYIGGQDRILLADHVPVPAVGEVLIKVLDRVPRRWLQAIAAARPRVVHAHFGTNADPALAIGRALRIPVVVTHHGVDITAIPRNVREIRRRRAVFANAARVIAVSEFIAGKLREAGCPPSKITVHHIGVDTDHFSPGSRPRAASRVLFAGRLVPKKGLVHLIRALARVRRTLPAELVVAGDGPLRAEMERLAAELQVPATFLGVRSPEEIRDLMREATLLCGPGVVEKSGNTEGLPMTFMEAQATGLPVVASTSGGSGEGIVHGKTGFLFEPGDEDALAEHLTRVLGDPELRRAMSAAARAHVLERFDLRKQTAKLEEIYDEVSGE